jgi:hypothetical protein
MDVVVDVFCWLFCDRKSFLCELSDELVDEFRDRLRHCPAGLPLVVLQFVEVGRSHGMYFNMLFDI